MPISISDIQSYISSTVHSIKSVYEKLMNHFFKSPATILFLGIDNAGKTTLVQKLKNNVNSYYLPTHNSSYDKIEIGNLKAIIVDIGGHRAARKAWKDYFFGVDGVVFLVDVYDDLRFAEVAEAWKTVIELETKASILVLMNKIDMFRKDDKVPISEPDADLKHYLESVTKIGELRNPNQNVNVIYTSIINEDIFNSNTPLRKGFEWLSKSVNK